MKSSGVSKHDYLQLVRSIEAAVPAADSYVVNGHESVSEINASIQIPSVDCKRSSDIAWLAGLRSCVSPMQAKGIVDNVIIHGSFGDYSYTPFSDLEITLLLSEGTIANRYKLAELTSWRKKRLNPFIVRTDPLQHHGPFYLWPALLRGYDENILPIRCYEAAWALEPTELIFSRYTPDDSRSGGPLLVTLQSLSRYETTYFQNGLTPYSIKRFLSNIMLLPAFFYQSKGTMYTKREAILRLRDLEIGRINNVIDYSTEARDSWPTSPQWLGALRARFIKEKIPSGRIDRFILNLYRQPKLQNSVQRELLPMIPAYCQEIQRLYENDPDLQQAD